MITTKITTTITRKITQTITGARQGGAPNPLVWHAAYPDSSGVMRAQLKGVGSPSFTNSALLLPDHEGVYVSVDANSPTWHGARWVDGVPYGTDESGDPLATMPSLYAAPAMTNSLTYSNDLTNAAWNETGTSVAALDEAGLTGAPNTATTLTDDDAGLVEFTRYFSTITSSSNTHTARFFIKKDNDETRFPEVGFDLSGGTLQRERVQINTKTGASATRATVGTTDSEVQSVGDWWVVYVSVIDNATGNSQAIPILHPAIATSLGSTGVTATGSIIAGNAELHLNKTIAEVRGSAPIITAGSAVTTSAVGISYDIANHDDAQGGYYCEWMVPSTISGIASAVAGARLYYTGNVAYTSDGTNSPAASVVAVPGDFYQQGAAYGDSLVVNGDGTWSAVASYDGAFATESDIVVASYSSGVMLIRNIRRYDLPYHKAKAKITDLMT